MPSEYDQSIAAKDLVDAAHAHDAQTAQRLLEDAQLDSKQPCAVLDLVESAHKKSSVVGYSLFRDGDNENLNVYASTELTSPLAGVKIPAQCLKQR